MNNYKLCAFDLDGTLMSSDLTLSEKNKKAIRKFREMGVHFVPCTGRTLSEMSDTVNNPDIRYYIYSNGAAIWDKKTDENIFCGFSRESAVMLLDILLGFDCFVIVHFCGKTYVDMLLTDENAEKYNVGYNVRELIRDFANITDNLKETVCEMEGIESLCVLFRNREDTDKCRELLYRTGECSVVDGWECNLEIFRRDTSKGRALEILSEKLSIDLCDTIAVGDSGNDISMIKAAGLGLAMSNGCDALKSVADEVICSNDEDVAEFVLEKQFRHSI